MNALKRLTSCIDISCPCTWKAQIRHNCVLVRFDQKYSIFALKGELNGKIVLSVAFLFSLGYMSNYLTSCGILAATCMMPV